jgi:uncharacterized protein YfaS (alpha-2-macroglobulin family)
MITVVAFDAPETGSSVRLAFSFTDENGDPIDPATLEFRVKDPNGVTTVYTYGGSPNPIEKDSTGNYHLEVLGTLAGEWFYHIEGSNTLTEISEGSFTVRISVM